MQLTGLTGGAMNVEDIMNDEYRCKYWLSYKYAICENPNSKYYCCSCKAILDIDKAEDGYISVCGKYEPVKNERKGVWNVRG